jgi:hypothetical protein
VLLLIRQVKRQTTFGGAFAPCENKKATSISVVKALTAVGGGVACTNIR